MMNMLGRLNAVTHQITPHLSDATSGILNKIGIVSLATGGTNAIVTTAIETQNQTWLTISDTVAIISIIGSIVFITKLCVDIFYARKKDSREQKEHNRKMNNDNPKG
jgi:hypothetical protein